METTGIILYTVGVRQDPPPPQGPLVEPLWSLIVGVWGIIEGSCGV